MHIDPWRPPRLSRDADRALLASVVAVGAGAALGTLLASHRAVEAAPWLRAWTTDPSGARNALATMLGIQITLVTIALSTTTLAYQSIASQYSPRLLGLLSSAASLYREIPLFVLSSAYTVAGMRELGLAATSGAEPRPVVLGGMLLVIIALTSVLVTVARTFRRLQVEEILRRTRAETMAATRRLARARRSLTTGGKRSAPASPDATPIVAPRSGYVVGFDVARLDRLARRFGACVRIDRAIGQFVARGEALGWVSAPEDSDRDLVEVAARLAHAAFIDRRRSTFLDVGFGLRVLSDVAERALSPAVNDPTTACQSLQQIRVILRALVREPLGDAAILDDRGEIRVSIALPRFQDYVTTAVDGPSRSGAGDPAVVAEILELAIELGRAADRPERRAAAREIAARAVADAGFRGEIDPARLDVLRDKERAVRLALTDETPPR